jgi:hypothetical protein
MPTVLANGQRSPRKLLAAVVRSATQALVRLDVFHRRPIVERLPDAQVKV